MTEPTTPTPTPPKSKKPRKSAESASAKSPPVARSNAAKATARAAKINAKEKSVVRVDRPKSPLRSYRTEVAVEQRVELREFLADFTEDEVRDVLRAHVIRNMLPEHYRATRKPVPPEYAEDKVHSVLLHVPTVQDEYQPDGKFELRVRFNA